MNGSYMSHYFLNSSRGINYNPPTAHERGISYANEQWHKLGGIATTDLPRIIRQLADIEAQSRYPGVATLPSILVESVEQVEKTARIATTREEFLRGVDTGLQLIITKLDERFASARKIEPER